MRNVIGGGNATSSMMKIPGFTIEARSSTKNPADGIFGNDRSLSHQRLNAKPMILIIFSAVTQIASPFIFKPTDIKTFELAQRSWNIYVRASSFRPNDLASRATSVRD